MIIDKPVRYDPRDKGGDRVSYFQEGEGLVKVVVVLVLAVAVTTT